MLVGGGRAIALNLAVLPLVAGQLIDPAVWPMAIQSTAESVKPVVILADEQREPASGSSISEYRNQPERLRNGLKNDELEETAPEHADDGSLDDSCVVDCCECEHPQPFQPTEDLQSEDQPTVNPVVRVLFDANGNIIDAILMRSSGDPALDQAALEAVQEYRFDFDTDAQIDSIQIETDFSTESN
ncbi:MAG: energy transducer TonB [Cyanobacteria bacterium P01_D01_bin.71]